ncbi:9631_t:CDS:2, partial [Gigaspora margarita]
LNMVWCYCSLCGDSGKNIESHTERLHRQANYPKSTSIFFSTNTSQEKVNESLLNADQSFDILEPSVENLDILFLDNNILSNSNMEQITEQEEQEIEQNNNQVEQINLNYTSEIYNQQTPNYKPYSILSNTFKDSFNLTTQWVLLWIFLFQQIFTLPYTAITALLIFIKSLAFNNDLDFPETLYKAKNAILSKKTIIQFAICEKCHSLTNLDNISNILQQANCNECKTLLKKSIRTSKGKIIYKPIKVYPYQSILNRLATLLQRPGFENLLESCYERKNITKHTVYSVAGIYLTILNLPRNLRFKKENTIFVGLIPGPKEPSVEKINSYLEPL